MNEDFLHKKLNERKEQNSFRQLSLPETGLIDFCSNDYLGIERNKLLEASHGSELRHAYGSTGSRLLTGNYSLIEETEKLIARFHNAESALIFNSGYDANIGLLSSVPQRGDSILYDYLSHASIRDGIRLSFAESFSFQHNDLNDLENKLKKSSGNIFVVTESVFSMDGDMCPLNELITLCENYNARLIIDEAHATGVIGEKGEGLVQMLNLESRVFARIHTFGKAIAIHGAVVLGSTILRDYLINFARSFIYSTALPEQTIGHIKSGYELFPFLTRERAQLSKLIELFKSSTSDFQHLISNTPIQGVLIPGNEKVKKTAFELSKERLDVRPILYPTVPKGQERLRIVLHSFNTENEIEILLNCLKNRS
ncbi:MAG: pyridoxal phosphate-dependent aminotransferase family protein [Bacteroidia bacterium]|nr:pyridoxal phosphate-dependent aminotransferase family protein [Bacteroidia bacterium]